jgi:hypothetical protein
LKLVYAFLRKQNYAKIKKPKAFEWFEMLRFLYQKISGSISDPTKPKNP